VLEGWGRGGCGVGGGAGCSNWNWGGCERGKIGLRRLWGGGLVLDRYRVGSSQDYLLRGASCLCRSACRGGGGGGEMCGAG